MNKKTTLTGVMALLCLLCTSINLTAQTTITGTVRNTAGEPLSNATVTVVKTNKGTITNARGVFTLNNISNNDKLRIGLIGYTAQTITAGNATNLTITLKEADNELDRVVVQAYGITSQRLATGNIGKLSAKDIEKQPVMNVLDALQGQIPGVVVSRSNGYASGKIKLEIRGRNMINGAQTSEPLYIIDGVPLTILSLTANDNYTNGSMGVMQSGIAGPASGQSPFFNINPADIESIEVLKDADATAIYGSRAANGVILITTKKGRVGKAKLDFSAYTGYSEIPDSRFATILNTQQYVEMRKEALKNDGLPLNVSTAADIVVWDTTRYTDWHRLFWSGTGRTTDINAALSGGDAHTNFRVGANFHNQTDITTRNGSNLRGGFSTSLNHQSSNQKFLLALSSIYTVSAVDIIRNPTASGIPPNAPGDIFDVAGNLNYQGWQPLNNRFPFSFLLQPYAAETNLLNTSLKLKYEILDGLSFQTNLGYNSIVAKQDNRTTIASQDPTRNPTARIQLGSSFIKNILVEPQLEWNRFLTIGKLNILLGSSYQRNKTEAYNLMGEQITNDALINNISSAPRQTASNNIAWHKYLAVFGRINYNLGNRYLLNINFRRDGSSKFGPGRQFGNFASIGGAYIFTETEFFKKRLSFISVGKIRGSYGTTGGDQIQDYQFLTAWSFLPNQYNGSQALIPIKHTDSTLHWQVNRKLEFATTLSFFKDRLTLDISWYRNRCDNQLLSFPTPSSTGFTFVIYNSPANVQNTGWEFVVSGQPVNGRNFKYQARVNLGLNRNKLLSYPDFENSPYASALAIGQSLNVVKVLHSTGVDPQTGEYQFEDKNGDGQVSIIDNTLSANDDRYFKDFSIKFDGGINHSFRYKKFSLDIFFYFRKAAGRSGTYAGAPGRYGNQPVEVLGRWQKPGDDAPVASFTTKVRKSDQWFSSYSDGIFTDASFVRLQNMAISYTLPERWVKRLGIGSCRFNLSGRNLFVISHYKGADPEIGNALLMPMPRIFTAGLSINL